MDQGNGPAKRAQVERSTSRVFTRYVETITAGVEPPTEQFGAVWQALRGRLRRELGRRGLWLRPPSFLGVLGYPQWTEHGPGSASGDGLDELTAACFSFVFVDRIANLQAQLTRKEHIEGIVVRSARNFVQELQERHDPMGTRAFKVLHGTLQRALDAGALHVVDGPSRLGANTVLAFTPHDQRPADGALVSAQVDGWNDQLMPALITTTGRGHAKLEADLQALIVGLRAVGIEAFRVADVLDPLRRDLRQRWTATFQAAFDAGTDEETDERLVSLVRAVAAGDRAFEERNTFDALARCVEAGLRDVDIDLATRRFLRALWRALASWAVSLGHRSDPQAEPTLEPDIVPSRRQVGRTLKIPRDRLPKIYMMVGDLVEGCRASIHAPASDTRASSKEARPVENNMDLEKRQRALVQQSLDAAAKARPPAHEAPSVAGGVPQVGNVYTFAHEAAEGLEWVLLRLPNDRALQVLLVAADTDPQAGPGDVVVPTAAAGGPLTLRSGHTVSLPLIAVSEAVPSRRIDPDLAHTALQATMANVGEDGEPDEDNDPDFRAWIDDVAAAVQELEASFAEPAHEESASTADPLPFQKPAEPKPTRSRPWLVPLAATLAICTLGLGWWNVGLRQETNMLRQDVTELREPRVADEIRGERLFDATRGPKPWKIEATSDVVELVLTANMVDVPCAALRIDLDRPDETTAWSKGLQLGDTEIAIQFLTSFLRQKEVTMIRVYSLCGAEPILGMEQAIELVVD